jgi:hypothetical protein
MMVLLIFGLCAIACAFIILSAVRVTVTRYKSNKSSLLPWSDASFWLSSGFALVSLGLLEFCLMRIWQGLFTTHVPFVQSRTWAMVASVTILLGLCAKMRVLAINQPSTGRRFLIAAGVWCAFCMAREALIVWYGYY